MGNMTGPKSTNYFQPAMNDEKASDYILQSEDSNTNGNGNEGNGTGNDYGYVHKTGAHFECSTVRVRGANYADCDGIYKVSVERVSWAPSRPVYKHINKDRYLFWIAYGYGWSIGQKSGLAGLGAYYHTSGLDTLEPWKGTWKGGITVVCVKCIGSSSDLDCCSSASPCQEKQGNCNGASDCAGSLVCGQDNCNNFNPMAKPTADCCMAPKVTAYYLKATGSAKDTHPLLMGIYGVSEEKYNNFPVYKQVGGPGLIYVDFIGCWDVGYNSLKGSAKMCSCKGSGLSPPANGWKYWCRGWRTDSTITLVPANQVNCIGSSSDLDCCSSTTPCQRKQGNCNGDSDCAGSLVCGQDNCKDFNPMAKPTADCCMAQKGNNDKCDPNSNPTRKDNVENVTLFSGTVHELPNIIRKIDGTEFNRTYYIGKQQRNIYDGRINGDKNVNVLAFIFKSFFSDNIHMPVEFRINPEFKTKAKAEAQAVKYSKALGRIPLFLRARIDIVELSKGTISEGGNGFGNFCERKMSLGTGYGRYLTKKGTLENLFIHEGSHVSLDYIYNNLGEWICAQNDDGKFISSYARSYPDREDMAESLVAWYAVTINPERLSQEQANKIKKTIPHRLQFFNRHFNKHLNKKT